MRSWRALFHVVSLVAWAGPAWAGVLVVDMLDVGQGDAILVRAEGRAVLVDAGPDDGITAQLDTLGVRRLDLAVGTHPHADHIGGMDAVLNTLDVRFYMDNGMPHSTGTYASVMAAVEGRRVRYVAPEVGRRIALGSEVSLTVLAPPAPLFADTRSDLNSNSVILLVEHGSVRMLLMGDAEEPTEAWLAAQGLPDIDVLKVSHHGSEHSSVPGFLAAADPEVALISCGANNKYGHPDAPALSRLAAVGATVYRTDTQGQVRVLSDGTRVEVQTGAASRFGASVPDALTPVAAP